MHSVDEITQAPPASSGPPASSDEPAAEREPKFELDAKAQDGKDADSKFAFSPDQLHRLTTERTLTALRAFGGIDGLSYGLRTDCSSGLGVDEDVLDGTVTAEEALEAARSKQAPKMSSPDPTPDKSPPSVKSQAHAADEKGFSDRRRVFLENRLPKPKHKSFLQLAWLAFNDKLIFLLSASATVSLALGIYEAVAHGSDGGGANLEWIESVTIMAAIAVIVFFSAANDWHKNFKFEKLNQKKDERWVTVMRSGKNKTISIFDILVGDLVRLEAGDVVPTDGILVDGFGIQCNESPVTGESGLVPKTPAHLAERRETILDADPFIFSGTRVDNGIGSYLVTAVGKNSIYGRIQMSLRGDVEETPLQLKLGRLAKYIIVLGFTIGIIFFFILLIRWLAQLKSFHATPQQKGEAFLDIFMLAVTVVVIGVPEGLSLAVAVALAFATTRMLRDNNLVRLLRSVEIMGNSTTVCSDKTGTLTQNKMSVVCGVVGGCRFGESNTSASARTTATESSEDEKSKIDTTSFPTIQDFTRSLAPETGELFRDSVALNATAFERDGAGTDDFVGSSTETALLKFGRDHLGMGPLTEERSKAEIIELLPFHADRKWMAAIVKTNGKYRLLAKGAAEVILANCSHTIRNPRDGLETEPLDLAMRNDIAGITSDFALGLLRPIAIAYRDFDAWPPQDASLDGSETSETKEDDVPASVDFAKLFRGHMTFGGMFGIRDPLRPEVIQSVRQCQAAGVFVRIVTGDNFLTAKAIASECGIYTAGGIALDGPTFRRLTPDQMDLVVPRLQVLARSTPDDKQVLVRHLQKMGETVAVTGDGTNDAFALKSADVGFAMGLSGTEIAKEASDIILMDDNFASIVKALAWGRAVNDAAKKFIQFQLTINITAGLLTIVSTLVGSTDTAIFEVIQLLWLNLIMDIFAALALATDVPSKDLLERRPEPRNASIINVTMWKMILGQAIYQLAVVFTLHYAADNFFTTDTPTQERQLQTLVFNTYMFMQLFNQTNCRRVDNRFNVFEGAWRNPWFIGVQAITLGGQLAITFKGNDAFKTEALTGPQWGWTIFFGILTIPIGAAIRTVPDSFVLAIAHKLRPLSLPVRSVVRFFRQRRNKGLTGIEATVDSAINEHDPAEPDEERRIRRFNWRWLRGCGRRARKTKSVFAFPIAPSRRLRRGNTVMSLVAVGLATAGVGVNNQQQRMQWPPTPTPDVGGGGATGEKGAFDVERAIEVAREQPGNRRGGLEVHPDTKKDDPIVGPLSKRVPPSQDPDLRSRMGI